MTEWGVLGVLITLAGLAVRLVRPLVRVNTSMSRLAVLVEELSDKLSALETETSAVRGEVQSHETRITVLEMGGKKSAGI